VKLTTKGRYGTRALLDIALNCQEGPVTLKEIARRQQIPLSYLEHLISPLVEGGVIRSARGVGGGVSLAKSPGEIRLSEVIELLENSMAPAECVDNPGVCQRSQYCATRDIWRELKAAMDGVLQSRTLEDLMERQKGKG
jgi:Rrf2 family cysteine metabolism transcriptional repressor